MAVDSKGRMVELHRLSNKEMHILMVMSISRQDITGRVQFIVIINLP